MQFSGARNRFFQPPKVTPNFRFNQQILDQNFSSREKRMESEKHFRPEPKIIDEEEEKENRQRKRGIISKVKGIFRGVANFFGQDT